MQVLQELDAWRCLVGNQEHLCSEGDCAHRTVVPGLTPANSDKNSGGLMRLFTRKTNKLQPKFEMTGGFSWHAHGRTH